jgi:hypothetical protein
MALKTNGPGIKLTRVRTLHEFCNYDGAGRVG